MNEIFNPPFKYIDFIKAKKIKQSYSDIGGLKKIKIAIFQGSTVDELKNILELFLLNEGFQPVFYISDYNRFYEEAHFPRKKLIEFSPDIVYVHVNNKNIMSYPDISDNNDIISKKVDEEINKYQSIWKAVNENLSCNLIQNNFENPFFRFLGSFDSLSPNGVINYINRINSELAKKIMSDKNVYLNDINYLSAKIGLDNWFDSALWYVYKYAVSYNAIPYIAHNITKIVMSIYGGSKKLLITDLDNTLWGGAIGDAGVENILVGSDSPESEAYYDIQAYLKYLKSYGILLAVSSKNEEQIAQNGINAKKSPLNLKDFSSFKANWKSKDINVKNIVEELNLSQDHTVFVDDNPVERGIVNLNLTNISVPEIDDVSSFTSTIASYNYFERKNITNEDIHRVKYYKDEIQRKKTSSLFNNYSDYLNSLEMVVKYSAINQNNANRVVQLINKTNQFNPTTKRYTSAEIEKIISDDKHITLTATLSDKYGDNGLVSIVILKLTEKKANIDLWVMSCRVFQRELEFAMFDRLIEELNSRNINELFATYIPTNKNTPVKDIFKKMDFSLIEEGQGMTSWKMKILSKYQKKNLSIRIDSS
jgi:FkbH-like protein